MYQPFQAMVIISQLQLSFDLCFVNAYFVVALAK